LVLFDILALCNYVLQLTNVICWCCLKMTINS